MYSWHHTIRNRFGSFQKERTKKTKNANFTNKRESTRNTQRSSQK